MASLLSRLAGRDLDSLTKQLAVEAQERELAGELSSVADFDAFVEEFKRERLAPEAVTEITARRGFYRPRVGDLDFDRAEACGLRTEGLVGYAGDEAFSPFRASWAREAERQPAAVRYYFDLEAREPEELKRQVGEKLLESRLDRVVGRLRGDVEKRLGPAAPEALEAAPAAKPELSSVESAASPAPAPEAEQGQSIEH